MGDDPARPRTDPDVLDRLVSGHREFLAYVERRVGSRELAEDILQDAFVRAVEKLPGLEKHEAATAWFYRVLRNAVIDRTRRRAAADRGLAGFASELESADAPGADDQDALCRCVAALAGTLKPEYAEAIRRVDLEGAAVKDFAGLAGITPGHASVRLFRAREALRRQVIVACGTCAEHGCLDCSCPAAPRRQGATPGPPL